MGMCNKVIFINMFTWMIHIRPISLWISSFTPYLKLNLIFLYMSILKVLYFKGTMFAVIMKYRMFRTFLAFITGQFAWGVTISEENDKHLLKYYLIALNLPFTVNQLHEICAKKVIKNDVASFVFTKWCHVLIASLYDV